MKEILEINIDKIISKIDYVTRNIKWISYSINWKKKKKMLVELEYNNLINNFTSQKPIKKFQWKNTI